MSPMIAQILVYGDSYKNACVTVVVIEQEVVQKWATQNAK